MGGYRTALAAVLLVAACGGNPFIEVEDTDTTLDPQDPNTSVDSKFAWDPSNDLTMNAVTYDRTNNQLVINNLPFDGPDGRYDNRFTMANGARVYESRQTATTGLVKHYAVFIESDYMQATAAAGANWIQYGNAGANINRSAFNLPAAGEYVYVGNYAANRTFDSRSGIELVSGNVELLVDVSDFDPEDGIQGDIVGTIYNRTRVSLSGAEYGRDLPDIFLAEVSFDTTNGTFGENSEGTTPAGEAGTSTPSGDAWSTGTYGGLFGGPAGEELGGFLIMEGTADIQVVTYEVVTYQVGTASFTSSGLEATTLETLQAQINAGQTLPTLLNAPATIPPDAINIIRQFYSIEVSTDYNAREIGVFVGDQQSP